MGIRNIFQHNAGNAASAGQPEEIQQSKPNTDIAQLEKTEGEDAEAGLPQKPTNELPDDAAQDGVRKMEAVTLAWSKRSLTIIYICVMSGATYLPVAKILDLWGRPQGFFIMASMATLGLVLMAVTSSVQTFCAAQVFYSIGFTGMIFCVDVITADTSSLKDRGLAFAFTSSPYIITALAGPAAAEGFYEDISWRWAFGCFAIILPFVAIPMFVTLLVNETRAKKRGLLIREPSGRTILQSIWHYTIEFDAIGVILIAAGLVLFLLPFSIAGSTADDWRSPSIIAMLVVGVVLLLIFGITERYFSPKPFIPFNLLVSGTILGSCLIDATYQVAYYCWGSYFTSYLQVVNGLTITQAGWVSGIFDIIAGCWLLFIGFVIRKTGYFKWLMLCAVPLYTLGVGLMIYFRQPHTNVGFIIMCQVMIAFAGATIILCIQVAVMAVAKHGEIAAVLAMLGVFGNMGGAIGNSISGAIWTHTLPEALQSLLPDDYKDQWEDIYDDLDMQLSFEMGDPVREAIIQAYGMAQKRMLIAGTAIMAFAFIGMLLIKNVRVNSQQMKGVVF
ncbi:hypothetical protein AA313_de0206836 [Arthrobotrys entomopaga]|nr:hypothetical protein AA313_de0206836 [Arthrobotrys entomopaga]